MSSTMTLENELPVWLTKLTNAPTLMANHRFLGSDKSKRHGVDFSSQARESASAHQSLRKMTSIGLTVAI